MSIQFYILQVTAIAFSYFTARHNAPAVKVFEIKGIEDDDMAQFHRYNSWGKFLFCVQSANVMSPDFKWMFFAGVVTFLWIYLTFDPFLNWSRPGKGWDYIGSNDGDGRRWIKWFGSRAGEAKAIILSLAIIALNVAIILFA